MAWRHLGRTLSQIVSLSKRSLIQSKNCGPQAFGLGDDKRGGRGLFQAADTSVIPHSLFGCTLWGPARNAGSPYGKFRKAGESLEQEDPGDLKEQFLKKQ